MSSTLIPCTSGSGSSGGLTADFHSGFRLIPSTLTVTINFYKQMTCWGIFEVDGILNIDGDLILEP